MKKLFFALLVFNLVFWLWGKRQELVPEPVSIEPGVGVIRLLDADAVAARREAAAARVTVPGGAPAPSGEPAGALPPAARAEAPARVEGPTGVAVPAMVDEPTAAPAVPVAEASPPVVVPDRTETPGPSLSATAPSGADVPPPEVAGGAAEDAPLRPSEAPAETPPRPAPEGELAEREDASDLATPPGAEPKPADLVPAIVETPPSAAPVAVAAAPVVEAPPELMSAPAAGPASAPEDAVVCESIGPFRDRAGAERYAAGMPAPLRRSGVREEVVARAARYWVVAPAARDADPVYRQALVDAGVHDAWRVKTGTLAGRLSLGSFLVEDNARKQIALLAGKGVAAELQPVKEQERRWWVDYERPLAASPARSPAGSEPAKQVVGRHCGRVAAP